MGLLGRRRGGKRHESSHSEHMRGSAHGTDQPPPEGRDRGQRVPNVQFIAEVEPSADPRRTQGLLASL